ncbi:holin [Streptomyces sp. IBSBF 2435]|uniref:holin n=1 Tax=Streptomyces sp. IBSBF 2435 TaxID=2903531 RepID=UPI002FDBD6BD
MPTRRSLHVCSRPGCPNLTDTGRCTTCRAAAEKARGSPRQRGYDQAHESRFRAPVLARDTVCVLCGEQPARHADHWPHDRRELVRRGLDPNDPRYGRGLCGPCHSKHTAAEQPGGWHR